MSDAAQHEANEDGAVRNVLVHAHIFKNAGSTFDWSLERSFREGFVDHRADSDLDCGGMDYLESYLRQNPKIVAFSSHRIAFRVEDRPDFKFQTVHFLRHPIARVRSVYEFERRDADNREPGGKMAKRLSLKEFVSWYMSPGAPATIRNGQSIFCAREGFDENPDAPAKALQLLEESRLIGIVEMYAESMVLFEHYLGGQFPALDLAYVKQNETGYSADANIRKDPVQSVLDEIGEVAPDLIAKNQGDLDLYENAKSLLIQRIAEVPDFEQKLQSFRQRCAELQVRYDRAMQSHLRLAADARESP